MEQDEAEWVSGLRRLMKQHDGDLSSACTSRCPSCRPGCTLSRDSCPSSAVSWRQRKSPPWGSGLKVTWQKLMVLRHLSSRDKKEYAGIMVSVALSSFCSSHKGWRSLGHCQYGVKLCMVWWWCRFGGKGGCCFCCVYVCVCVCGGGVKGQVLFYICILHPGRFYSYTHAFRIFLDRTVVRHHIMQGKLILTSLVDKTSLTSHYAR